MNHLLRLSSLLVLSVLLLIPTACDKDEKNDVDIFHDNISDLSLMAVDFIDKAIIFETTVFDENISAEEIKKIFDDYIASGEAFVNSLNIVINNTKQGGDTEALLKDAAMECVNVVTGLFDISGISPASVKALGDLIGETKDASAALEQAYNSGQIQPDEYNKLRNQLRNQKLLKLSKMGGSGLMGTLAAGSVAAAKISAAGTVGVGAIMTAPALITIGAVGAGTAYVSYRLFSWYSGTNKNTGEQHTIFTAFEWELDTPFPAFLFGKDAQVAISIDGYAPVLIDRIRHPEEGHNMFVEIDPVRSSDLKSSNYLKSAVSTQVCYRQELIQPGSQCEQVMFVTAYPSPANPAAGQSVTVIAHVLPAVEGCEVHFSIVGTDGYSNDATHTTNASGRATFGIPGADPGVFDRVTITASNGATQVVSYTFGGSSKEGESQGIIRR